MGFVPLLPTPTRRNGMNTEFGTWLRAQREERGWSRSDMARRLIAAAREAGDDAMPAADNLRKSIHRWEAGQVELSDRYRLLYCRVLGIKPVQFGQQPDSPSFPAPQPAALRGGAGVPSSDLVDYRGIEAPGIRQATVTQEVLMAAHEGSDHAAHAEEHGIGEATLEQLHADIARLSVLSDTGEPFPAFLDMRRVRERVYQLLDRRLWPAEQADLYFLLGVLNGLMGVAADRLGYPESAEELLRAGWAYAVAIDHRPLLAALRQQQSYIATWHGRPRRGRDLAADGLRYVSAGPTAANLHIKLANAAAQLGDMDTASRAVTASHEARGSALRDDLAEIGGEFAISQATHHYLAGSALSEIGGAQNDAAAEIERAVTLYAAGPGPGEQHWFGARALASIDLAVIRLRSGALDAAATTLEPALSVVPAQRIVSLTSRMQLVRMELAAPVFRGSAQAQQLDELIEEFGRDSVTAGLHALPGGPA
jgi:transcriptional regulator with XRE-family HTH domain